MLIPLIYVTAMLQSLSLEAAYEYCESHQVNMLLCEHCYLRDDAVFKLYHVKEDLLVRFIKFYQHAAERKMILPYELCRRKSDIIHLDTSFVDKIWI